MWYTYIPAEYIYTLSPTHIRIKKAEERSSLIKANGKELEVPRYAPGNSSTQFNKPGSSSNPWGQESGEGFIEGLWISPGKPLPTSYP